MAKNYLLIYSEPLATNIELLCTIQERIPCASLTPPRFYGIIKLKQVRPAEDDPQSPRKERSFPT